MRAWQLLTQAEGRCRAGFVPQAATQALTSSLQRAGAACAVAENRSSNAMAARIPRAKRAYFPCFSMNASMRWKVSPILVRSGEWPGLRSLSK